MTKKKQPIKKAVEQAPSTPEPIELPVTNDADRITGIGDILHQITKSMGIEACEECLKRKEALNRVWSFLKKTKREITPEEVAYIKDIQATNKVLESGKLFKLYNSIFGTHMQPCQCPGIIKEMVFKLGIVIQRDYDTLQKEE